MLYTLIMPITILYIVFIPIGLIISFISTENFTRYFAPLIYLEEYLDFINNKLEDFFLK